MPRTEQDDSRERKLDLPTRQDPDTLDDERLDRVKAAHLE